MRPIVPLAALLAFTASPRVRAAAVERPRLFLSCPKDCFDSYLRQELSYFDFTRDPYLADYTLVVVRQPAGNGGERFTVTVTPVSSGGGERPPRPTRSFIAQPGAPPAEARRELAQTVLRALHRQLAGTVHEEAFELKLAPRGGDELSGLADPWNYWVIAPELQAAGEGGSGFYGIEGTAAVTFRRITEPSKLRVRAGYTRRMSGFRLEDGSRVSGDVYGWDARGLYARSVKQHWALGALAVARASEFENLHAHLRAGLLVELNLFPYVQNASKQLRFAYQVGPWANWYFEPNVAGLLREVRPFHALSLIADVNQPWGSIQWVGQVNSFIDDPARYRLSTGAVVTLRLVRGLSVGLEGKAALVRDLINLRQRPIMDLELLLWTAQQPTDYTFEAQLVVTYTFGSVHNTIVNPRFGRIDLEEE